MAQHDDNQPRRRTPLYDVHVALGARIIDFGGWDMPVQYKTGIIAEHKAVRAAAGIFDVSHMGEARLRGPDALAAVQRLCTNDASALADRGAMYTVMCYEHGGIVDDCIVYRHAADEFLIVLNAGNTDKDLAWIRDHTGDLDVAVADESEATALIAVQGPEAVALADRLSAADLAAIPSFQFAAAAVGSVPCVVARTGYTGEDGFEIACPADRAVALWQALTAGEAGAVPCGLGARDTLRLEARLSLYGNDIDETTSPYEAGLGWVVKPDAGEFIGAKALADQRAAGVTRRLIGFRIDGRAIARHGYDIFPAGAPDADADADAAAIGHVTSGTKGISVEGSIGLGYVPVAHARPGGEIAIDCRGKRARAEIVKGKFYQR